MKNATPMSHFCGTGPQNRLSSDSPRLSPIMKYSPGGTVNVSGKVHSPVIVQGWAYGAFSMRPLRISCPLTIEMRSPGQADVPA